MDSTGPQRSGSDVECWYGYYTVLLLTLRYVHELSIRRLLFVYYTCTTEGQYKNVGAVVIKLPMQSVHITSKVVSFNPADGEVYSIQHYVIEFVSDLQQVFCFL